MTRRVLDARAGPRVGSGGRPRPSSELGEMCLVRQAISGPVVVDIDAEVRRALRALPLAERVREGQTVAVTAGSRGIAGIREAIAATVSHLREDLGLVPFVVPAMGSHGGATAEGQRALLAGFGITEQGCGCPVHSTMEVVEVARSPLGYPLVIDRLAAAADHVVVVNRVKPHTLYAGAVQSGLAKMLMVGLGKHAGAAAYHRAFIEHGFAEVISDALPILLDRVPVLAGVALVERGDDRTAIVEALAPEQFAVEEPRLLARAEALLPRLPFPDVDLLIVDEIGKDISGAGLDTNVVGRKGSVHHVDASAAARVRYIAVRSLTERSNGNAIGIGLAEFCRSRVVDAMDRETTWVNALTAGDIPAAMVPLSFATDAEMIDAALGINGLRAPAEARIVRIRNTLRTDLAACSATYLDEARDRDDLEIVADELPWPFDDAGNLPDHLPD